MEIDILIHTKDFKVIVVAKYKPRNEQGSISHQNAAQVSGYGRLNSIRKELNIENHNLLTNSLIIYTSNDSENKDIIKENLLNIENSRYFQLYKYSLQIPKIKVKL